MTRKDYNSFAAVLVGTIHRTAELLAADNPRFSHAAFLRVIISKLMTLELFYDEKEN